tara:strand:+ start:17955 stop:18662 length:708 start_codon:yes stop_codon:yes gene_type:complete
MPHIPNTEQLLQLTELAGDKQKSQVLENDILSIIRDKTTVNVKGALHRFGGSEELYVQSLNLFISDLLKNESEIKSLNDNLVLETIKPILHTLKGTSGLLGFEDLSGLALECEMKSLMLSGKSIHVEPMASLLELMASIREFLESAFKPKFEPQQSSVIPSAVDIKLDTLQKLRQELESSNMRAIDVFKELKQSIGLYSNDLAEMLESHVCKLQFKEALGELEKLEKQLSEHRHG